MARILIADDSLTIQKAFAMTFAGEDVTLLTARSADEGLTIARQSRPELVIADAVMPGRSGYDLCSAIKADAALREVPVYILTSAQNPYDEVRGKQSGADGQFIKPFESVAIVENVKVAIARGAVAARTPPPLSRWAFDSVAAAPSISGPPPPASVQTGHGSAVEDDYGEITIEDSGPLRDEPIVPAVATASPPAASPAGRAAAMASEMTTPPPAAQRSQVAPSSPAAAPGLRPSMIPGLRPGAAAPSARPGGVAPGRPVSAPGYTSHSASASTGAGSSSYGPPAQAPVHTPSQVPALRPAYPNASPQAGGHGAAPSRTLVGLPATLPQSPGRFGGPAAPARPPTQPVRPLADGRTPPPIAQVPGQAPLFPAGGASKLESKLDQKMTALAARGPEYEAIAKLSREIIEKIVWEVVPELAEVIIREEIQKRGRL